MESPFSGKPLRSGSNRGNARPSGPAACHEIRSRALRAAMGTWSGTGLSTAGSRPAQKAILQRTKLHPVSLTGTPLNSHSIRKVTLRLGRKDSDEGREQRGILLSASRLLHRRVWVTNPERTSGSGFRPGGSQGFSALCSQRMQPMWNGLRDAAPTVEREVWPTLLARTSLIAPDMCRMLDNVDPFQRKIPSAHQQSTGLAH